HATGGGHITDVAGNNIAFGFTVKSDRRLKGRCTVVDHAAGRMIKCLDVLALVQSGNMATFWGNATDNGMATSYMIQVFDNGEPGTTAPASTARAIRWARSPRARDGRRGHAR